VFRVKREPRTPTRNPSPMVSLSSFVEEEDRAIIEALAKYSTGPSSCCLSHCVSVLLLCLGSKGEPRTPTRNPPPMISFSSFVEEEDHAIIEAVAEHGTRWALIVRHIPGRTDNAVKNRWNSITRKLTRMQVYICKG